MNVFKLSILTPSEVVVKGLECNEIIAHTIRGEINILPGHNNLLSKLSPGRLTTYGQSGERHFHLSTGLIKVEGNKIVITSPTVEKAEQIDIDRAQSALSKAESRLNSSEVLTDEMRIKHERKVERARARIRVANLR